MTEEILQAAILQLRSKATEKYALIKDLYHQPATENTVKDICKAALDLAQFEGAMLTLQSYAPSLSVVAQQQEQKPADASAQVQTESEGETTPTKLSEEELLKRSPTARRNARARGKNKKTKETSE